MTPEQRTTESLRIGSADADLGRRRDRRSRPSDPAAPPKPRRPRADPGAREASLLRALGAEGAVCDVYDSRKLIRLPQERRPDVVVNVVTDLSAGSSEANNRARREGGRNLVSAAEAAGSWRLVLESVAFPLEPPAAEVLERMEQTALESPLDVLILRFGRLWGPATFHRKPPEPSAVHIADAGARAATLITSGPPGT